MNNFYVPKLKEIGAWDEDRNYYPKGYVGLGDRAESKINALIIHHTVTEQSGDARKDLDKLYSVTKKTYGMIPYHFVVTSQTVKDKDGVEYAIVHYTGDVASIRPHAPDNSAKSGKCKAGHGNTYFIGISFIGTFMGNGNTTYKGSMDRPTDAQLRSANLLCKELVDGENAWLPLLKGWGDVLGHKDAGKTACPGIWWPAKKNLLENPPRPVIIPPVEPEKPSEPCKDEMLNKEIERLDTIITQQSTEIENLNNQLKAIRDQLIEKIAEEIKSQERISNQTEQLAKLQAKNELLKKNVVNDVSVAKYITEKIKRLLSRD
jgi:hypothetical protein